MKAIGLGFSDATCMFAIRQPAEVLKFYNVKADHGLTSAQVEANRAKCPSPMRCRTRSPEARYSQIASIRLSRGVGLEGVLQGFGSSLRFLEHTEV